MRYLSRFMLVGLSALLLQSAAAFADLPLQAILDSAAGQFIFGTRQGSELALRLVGAEVAAAERIATLGRGLSRPELNQVAREVSLRFNRIHDRFAAKYPKAAESMFGSPAHVLAAEENAFLRKLIAQEMDRKFISFVPEIPVANLALNRGAFTAAPETPFERLQEWSMDAARFGSPAVEAFASYETLRGLNPSIERLLPKENVYRLLLDEESTHLVQFFRSFVKIVPPPFPWVPGTEALEPAFIANLRNSLHHVVPPRTIEARIKALRSGSYLALRRAMGEMTLKETQLLLHGGNPLKPTPESLLGQYLQQTGAASVVRTFRKGTGAVAGEGQGTEKLVVAVSEQTLHAYKYTIGNRNFLLGHLHTPEQGTLNLLYQNSYGTYAQASQHLDRLSAGTIIPTIVLSSSEGQRLAQFFKLGSTNSKLATLPWNIRGMEGGQYCATGGYNSCTHWFGNIPIGDKLVTEYKFPGMIDQYAGNQIPPTAAPRVEQLRPFKSTDPLIHRVWKVPGNQQLADTIGLQAQNLAGELANPGWVAHALTGAASVERVPVVFVVVADVRVPIDPLFDPKIKAY